MYQPKRYGLFCAWALMINLCVIVNAKAQLYSFEFYNGTFNFSVDTALQRNFNSELTASNVKRFYQQLDQANHEELLSSLKSYKPELD